ncbi:acyl--CoA ligase [Blastopirellula sp. JC732]|uniref:Acyl--CoA ligase n=1 Tax=Blastopirellula sediminis TaxID=2894196 RepID=A0A9X1MJ39_9BACT|nr:class I adenylate-forming enzyme family protein [Blastopirellula sediminis]MCC9607711.1 acyl--CoA ligase [Blastopirellula sediminis]MCC9627496.1 acyl--CoA ligase [Blastopirellula sediminis]
MALWRVLRDAASRFPDRIAVTAGGRDYTYADLDDRVERVAAGLRFQSLGPSDRVVTVLGNSIEHLTLLLGCFRASLVAVPLAPWTPAVHIRYVLRTSVARGFVASPAMLETVLEGQDDLRPDVTITIGDPNPPHRILPWEIVEAGPSDPPDPPDPRRDHLALIVYSSGTTSRPKGVVHTQERLALRVASFTKEIQLTESDVALVVQQLSRPLPLFGQVLASFQVGGRVVLHEGQAKGFWETYQAEPRATFVVAIPALTRELLANPAAATADHSKLRLWLSGGDAVSAALQTKFQLTTGRDLIEICGMTEAGFYAMNPASGPARIGSIGRPLEGIQVRLIDPMGNEVGPDEVGEILLETPGVMVGYWNDTAETFRVLRNGWLHTGDLARRDADGFLWLAGRLRDMINRGGRKIAPPMVEAALGEHPAVLQAVVVGAPDVECGQVPFAFLMLRPGAVLPTDVEWSHWLADKLELAAIPVGYATVEEWPLTYQGKLDRARLVWMAENGGAPV